MALKLRAKIAFPTRVDGNNGITVTRTNGVWTVGFDFTQLTPVLVSDPSQKLLYIYDTVLRQYNTITLGDAVTSFNAGVTINAGDGLTGGGDLSASRTLAVGAGAGITVNEDDVAISAIPTSRLFANISGDSAAPSANTLSAVLDAIIGSTQGALITRSSTGWTKLDPGTNGYFLKSQGSGADLAFAAIPGGGDMLAANNLSDVASVATARANLNVSSRGHLYGLALSTAGSSSTFSIAAGSAYDNANDALMTLASSLSKTTSAWAVGNANGGLDTGSIANNTWYHVYLIKRADTGVVDALISLSASAPTLPTNYTLSRRIGSLKTNGSAQWTAFTQVGDEFIWSNMVLDVSAANPGTSAVTRALSVPTGVVVWAKVRAILRNSSTGVAPFLLLSSLDSIDTTPDVAGAASAPMSYNGAGGVTGGGLELTIRTNTSAQIRSRISASDPSCTLYINTYGWTDRRGRD